MARSGPQTKQGLRPTEAKIFHGSECGLLGCHCLNVMGVAEGQMLLQARSVYPWRSFVGWTAKQKQRPRDPRDSSAQAQGALLHRSLPGRGEPVKEPWQLRRSWWGK